MRVALRLLGAAGAFGLLAWLGACSDSSRVIGPEVITPPAGATVSDPVSDPVVGGSLLRAVAQGESGVSLGLAEAESEAAYVAMAPSTFPTGTFTVIRNTARSEGTVTSAMTDGGFDAVPVWAAAGDVLEIEIWLSGGVSRRFSSTVPAHDSPKVIRTAPGRGKKAVPLNSPIVVYFSEPVAGASLTSGSIVLRTGGRTVPGIARVLAGFSAAVVFEPLEALEMNTTYVLVVNETVRDLSGEAVASAVETEFTTGTEYASSSSSASVIPDATILAIGSRVQLTAIGLDTSGVPVIGEPVFWSTNDPTVASVSSTGLVTGRANGQTHVRARLGSAEAAALIVVQTELPPVASVQVDPNAATIPLGPQGGTVRLTAVMRGANGDVLPFRQVGWSSSDPAIATVAGGSGGTAIVRGVVPGTVTITATSEGKSGTAAVTVVRPAGFARVSARGAGPDNSGHACGVTSDDWVLCWGSSQYGQLGNGIPGFATMPIGVGGIQFRQVSVTGTLTCALSPAGKAYCWGSGALGIPAGNEPPCFTVPGCSTTPVAVAGNRAFASIGAGENFACALTPAGDAYCWGWNGEGQLGIGTAVAPECDSFCSYTPMAVVGGLKFTRLEVGAHHACGLTSTGAAYCWGDNYYAQLGDGTQTSRFAPVRVAGGRSFVAIAVGLDHTCALTSDGTAYCWGYNETGDLGVGSATGPEMCAAGVTGPCSRVPVPVATSLRWTAISAGDHTCALTQNGQAYCWGLSELGALGNGSTVIRTSPTLVSGGHTFAHVSAGWTSSCGATTAGVAYCWGNNSTGQLGDGTRENSSVPVRVAGPPP